MNTLIRKRRGGGGDCRGRLVKFNHHRYKGWGEGWGGGYFRCFDYNILIVNIDT